MRTLRPGGRGGPPALLGVSPAQAQWRPPRRGGGSPARDSPTGSEGDWEERGQRRACHGDPRCETASVAPGDSEGDRPCQRPGRRRQLRWGDPRCSSPEEGGQKGGSPDLAPPLACYRGGGE